MRSRERGAGLVAHAIEMLFALLVAFCAVGFVTQNFHGGTNPPYDPSIHVSMVMEVMQ